MSMIGSAVDHLLALLEMDHLGDDVFIAPALGLPARPGRMFGGEVAARALAAAQRTVSADRPIHVVHALFLRPGNPEVPTKLVVTRLRDGRTFSGRRVDVEQQGKLIFTAMFSFHVSGHGVAHADQMPRVPPPGAVADLADWAGGPRFWPEWAPESGVELRPVPVERRTGERTVWYRLTAGVPDDPRVHACLWLYASDLTLVSSIRLPHETSAQKSWQLTSLNHTVWFHRPFRVDEWHLLAQSSSSATGGRGLAHGQVFTEDGTLVSELTQEGLITPMKPLP
jgi:acyl-CoA thioesterase-2